MCTINENHMMYGFWDMEHDRYNLIILDYFLPFYPLTNPDILQKKPWCMVPTIRSVTEFSLVLDHFLPFAPPNNPENENFEKMKKKTTGVFIVLHKRTITIIQCMVLEIWSMTEFSQSLPPPTAQTIKVFWKMKKTTWRSLFYICVPKIMIRWCMVPAIWCTVDGWTDRFRWMDRWTDRQTKKVTYRGGCPT